MATQKINKRLKIGVIGSGNMGSSILRGLSDSPFYPQNLYVSDPDAKKTQALKKELHIKVAKHNRQLASICDVVILAVKPNVMESVLDEISLQTPKTTLVISIAAGVPLSKLQKGFKEKVPLVRVMPNMPALIGEGISAYALGNYTASRHRAVTEMILKSLGEVVEVREKLMDLVTALSGSGPAYFFLLAEKLVEAAYELGMKSDVAKKLVYQTALGSAKVMLHKSEDPDVLISRVASKGGTTEAALRVLKRKGFGKIITDAVQAACKRSEELREA